MEFTQAVSKILYTTCFVLLWILNDCFVESSTSIRFGRSVRVYSSYYSYYYYSTAAMTGGSIAGVVIGCIFGVVILVVGLVLCCVCCNKSRTTGTVLRSNNTTAGTTVITTQQQQQSGGIANHAYAPTGNNTQMRYYPKYDTNGMSHTKPQNVQNAMYHGGYPAPDTYNGQFGMQDGAFAGGYPSMPEQGGYPNGGKYPAAPPYDQAAPPPYDDVTKY